MWSSPSRPNICIAGKLRVQRRIVVEVIANQQRFGVDVQGGGGVLGYSRGATVVPSVVLCVERGFAREKFLVLHYDNEAPSTIPRFYRGMVGSNGPKARNGSVSITRR